MAAGKIIRFRAAGPQRRSGRHSAREAYRRSEPHRAGRRISTRAAYRRAAARPNDPRARKARALPPIEADRPGTDYAVRLGKGQIARIALEERGPDHRWIDWVYVPPTHRGRGLAGHLMARVLRDADAAGVRLSLEPRACAGVDQASLEAWYAGLGFAPTGEEGPFGPIFARAPEAPEAVRRAA